MNKHVLLTNMVVFPDKKGDGVTKNQVGLSLFPIRATSTGLWLGGIFDGTLKSKSTLTSTNASDVLIKLSPP